jgi:opacity protein-like surface antigen
MLAGLGQIHIDANVSLQDGRAFDVLRLRLPLMRSEEFPHGRIQPYIGGGPAVFFSWAKAPGGFQPSDKTDVDAAIGYKVGGGLAIMLNKEVGLFAEYRYTHFTSSLTFQDNTPPASTETFKTTLNTNHAIVGLTVRFP